ncbi:MAG: tRNA (pseudouridine(54)-N(1))-methyltransferase TrmY [Gammaproteobacteria bacterium]|nr:tRNA (pseudouridine(54)-N(1))-methyltransferase TrmY [Gammaproteobacteria bacterium]
MRTFVIRARKASVQADKVFSQIGSSGHFEIIAHTLMNAFYISNAMRSDVEVYVVLESSTDFPRTLKFSSAQGISFSGFHESAILEAVVSALKKGANVKKNEKIILKAGIEIHGFGFEMLMKELLTTGSIYLLDKKGEDIRSIQFESNSIFVLSDHLSMPKNNIKALERKGLKKISLGKKMLFASQSIVLVHNELDRQSDS